MANGFCDIFLPPGVFAYCNGANETITISVYNEQFCKTLNWTNTFPVGECVKHPYTKNTFMYVCCEDNTC